MLKKLGFIRGRDTTKGSIGCEGIIVSCRGRLEVRFKHRLNPTNISLLIKDRQREVIRQCKRTNAPWHIEIVKAES